MLGACEHLVAQKQHLVFQQQGMQLVKQAAILGRLGQLNAADVCPQRAGQGVHLQGLGVADGGQWHGVPLS